MINAALNLLPGAVGQQRPQIIPAVVAPNTSQTPSPAAFSDPLFVTSPTNTDSFWTVLHWTADHGGSLPQAGAACALFYDSNGALRCVWWDGLHSAPVPGGAAGGVLSGTFPNPGMAAGAAATNLGVPLTGSAWIAPTLINSWVNSGSPFETAAYLKDPLGFVHLRGLIQGGASSSTAFVLPAGFRPGATTFNALPLGSLAAGGAAEVDIAGNVKVWPNASNASLSSVTFLAEN